jgi:hypothetical protein
VTDRRKCEVWLAAMPRGVGSGGCAATDETERKRKRGGASEDGVSECAEGWCGDGGVTEGGLLLASTSVHDDVGDDGSEEHPTHGVVPSLAGARLATTLSDELLRVRGALANTAINTLPARVSLAPRRCVFFCSRSLLRSSDSRFSVAHSSNLAHKHGPSTRASSGDAADGAPPALLRGLARPPTFKMPPSDGE